MQHGYRVMGASQKTTKTATIIRMKDWKRRHVRASVGSSADGAATIPHKDGEAENLRERSASCITTYVSAGNFTKPFQLKAAPYLRPVKVATAPTPPSASITSAVVVSSGISTSMESIHNPSFLDTQYPNFIDTKKFGDTAPCISMASAGTDDDRDVALRCRALVRLYAGGNARKFAAEIDISDTRWNNITTSGALSRDVARRIYRKYPEVSLDWLYRGKDDALSRPRSDEMLKAFRAELATDRPEAVKAKQRAS